MSFVHRFGASLNRHLHYDENHPGFRATRALAGARIRARRIGHCCILDGVFESLEGGGVQFRQASALTREAAAAI